MSASEGVIAEVEWLPGGDRERYRRLLLVLFATDDIETQEADEDAA